MNKSTEGALGMQCDNFDFNWRNILWDLADQLNLTWLFEMYAKSLSWSYQINKS